jgi:uncharacterized protein with HEPN domain
MRPETIKLLQDMRDAATEIAEFTAGKTLVDYLREKQLRRAVERAFEIMGEALTQLHRVDAPSAERISNWRAIIGFRNVLIHGYGRVNHERTWDIVQTELPIVRGEIDNMLKS